ncbi:class I SAM-dependent methyltransferase [Rhodovibrionaceae bacterium A322]
MSAWSDGYVTDIPYTHSFFRELSPTFLNYCALMLGVEPPQTREGFTYLELGSGNGVTTNMLAATHPQGEFYGVDFMPAHTKFSAKVSANAKLDNVTFLERSFEDIAKGMEDLPRFDYITFHGIYSWISEENRHYMVDVIRRYLKPGGLVYCSYNSMPGWTAMAPIQWLLETLSHTYEGDSSERAGKALEFVNEMRESEFGFFKYYNDIVSDRLDKLKNHKPSYIAHEYLNGSWHPLFFKQVMAEMASGKMDFVGQAAATAAFPGLNYPPKSLELADKVEDPILRETILDFMSNNQFRRDIFSKAASRLPIQTSMERLMEYRYMGTSKFNDDSYEKQSKMFKTLISIEYFNEIGKWLDDKVLTWEAMTSFSRYKHQKPRDVIRVLAMLVQTNFIHPLSDVDEEAARKSTRKLNGQCPKLPAHELPVEHVACARMGTAMQYNNRITRQIISVLIEGCEEKPEAIADQLITKFSLKLMQDGKELPPKVNRARLIERAKVSLVNLPTWKHLGII